MRIFAKVPGGENGKDETLVVACTDPSRPLSSIVEELIARNAIREASGIGEKYLLRLAENGAILYEESRIGDVLKDGDLVVVGALNCFGHVFAF